MSDESTVDLNTLIPAIARALGGLPKMDRDNTRYCEIEGIATPLHLYHDTYRKRLNVSVNWPSYGDTRGGRTTVRGADLLPWDERNSLTMSITCDPTRAAEALAKDIQRRLVTPLTAHYQKAVEYCAKQTEAKDARATLARRTAERFNYSLGRDDKASLYPNGNGMPHISVSSDREIRFDSFYCDEQTACRILEVLKSRSRSDD